ncbi:MAG: hypothetical protein ACD_50C00311G0006 [uncultured bacterium]|nr:MAG: hypothetical protein ACD_50C00311G0006 [uncultured bacterium]OGH13867.1 MAG: UDP-N-acetylmuramate--L-alanine ligase [Candidatus Levybacteria bacterium RIFCSPHIGHO2_01_FULL_38_26]
MKKIKSIHFVGIKGAGMTPLAVMAKHAGLEVTGSDLSDVFITDEILKKMNISVFEGFDKIHIGDVDLVVATGAHGGLSNVEVKEAIKKGIKVVMQGQAVGLFMEGDIFGRKFTGISICGTNGKTTTTAMIATLLKSSGLEPSYIIGTSFVASLGESGHLGSGKYFVAEADEYATDPLTDKTAKFLWQSPKIIVLTNIDFDHPDIYPSIKEIKDVFRKFILRLPKDGLLVACGDDQNVRNIIKDYKGRKKTYGKNPDNDYVISDIKTENAKTQFELSGLDSTFRLSIFGEQNVLNATAAIIVGRHLGLSLEQLRKGILFYKGSKRRSEFVGKLRSGAMLFDDYAHNPTKVSATLNAFRNAYPDKKIVCIFQPHTYSRTKSLFEQFTHSFKDADIVIITNIYASLREEKDPSVSAEMLASKIKSKDVMFLPEIHDVVEYIDSKNYGADTVVVTMGAGDIYKIWRSLL